MSYEIDNVKEIKCPCSKGKIKLIIKSNEWNQIQEYVTIECEKCKEKYEIISEYFCPKPKHNYKVYYCRNKENGEKIKLEL